MFPKISRVLILSSNNVNITLPPKYIKKIPSKERARISSGERRRSTLGGDSLPIMEGDLIKKCQNLRINDAETEIVDVGDFNVAENPEQVSLLLVGRVITEKNFNVEAFKRTMTMAWTVSKRLVIRMIGPNKFIFQFFHWKDKAKVLEGRPWSFDNQLLVLSEVSGNEQASEVQLNYSPFWIRIKDLPFNCRNYQVCKAIALKLGYVMEVDDDGFHLDNYMRVRVMLDITKPLCRFQNLKGKDGRIMKVTFSYERLPFFCFLCGVIGHSEKDCCNTEDDDQDKSMGWGKYLRATPRRGVKKFLEEVEEVRSCRTVLFVPKPEDNGNIEPPRDKERSLSQVSQFVEEEYLNVGTRVESVDRSPGMREGSQIREEELLVLREEAVVKGGLLEEVEEGAKERVFEEGSLQGDDVAVGETIGSGSKVEGGVANSGLTRWGLILDNHWRQGYD